jgi:predicted CoA-binding protein
MIAEAPAASRARNIERLLRPRSVAVVGASSTPGALGASVVANLERMGFGGDIHLINPKRDSIGERRCLSSAAELPLGVDVAVLAIPRSAVIETVRELVKRQVGAAIIFSAGFAEGGEAGLADQRELARIAGDSGMVIEGPNCLGLVNYVDGIDANLFVYLEDVGPDGSISSIADGRQRASLRKVVDAPWNYIGLPWRRSNREDVLPLTPGIPVRVQFDLLPISYIFKAGHRMRVSVAGADYRERDRETANPAPTLTIYNSKEAPSTVILPVVPSA